MPRLSQVTTVKEEVTVEMTPELQKKLRKELHLYQTKSAQRKAIGQSIEELKGRVEDILAEVGEDKVQFEGFTAGLASGTRSVLDKKKFVKLGGNLAILNASYVDVPIKTHIRIYAPGDKDDE